MQKIKVALIVFNGVELLDFAGPLEILSVAGIPPLSSKNPPFSTAGDPANWDAVIIPGGSGSRIEMRNEKLLSWIHSFTRLNVGTVGAKRRVVMSVCTGSLILATTGILGGMKLTTHHHVRTFLKELVEEHGGSSEVVEDRVVEQVLKGENGEDLGVDIITCGGVSSGIDGALYLVKKLVGHECARGTAAWVEYDWKDSY